MFEKIDTSELTQLLSDFVATSSLSGQECELAEKIQMKCAEIGMHSFVDRHGNVISSYKWSESGPTINFNSHMDTVGYGEGWVRNPLGGEIEGKKLYGRGSADCKASLAAQILAVKAVIESVPDLCGEVVMTHVVEEEVQDVNRKGTVKLLRDGFKTDMAINGEPTNLNPCIACNGMIEMLITTIGKRAHASTPQEGVNAIFQMCRVLQELSKLKPGYNTYTGYGSIVPGVIRGGEQSGVVPDFCELKVSRFIVPEESGLMFYNQISEIFRYLQFEDTAFRGNAEIAYESSPFLISESEPIVRHLTVALEELFGKKISLSGTPQHCDADFLVNMGKIPTIIFGPGEPRIGHVANEYVCLDDVIVAAQVYTLVIVNALSCI